MDRAALHSQLASVMEVLANAAVAEICKLVDDGYALLRLQVTQAQRENRALKRRIQLLEPGPAREPGSAGGRSGDTAAESREGRPFGRQKRGRGDAEDAAPPPRSMEQSADMEEEAGPESLLIKEERFEEDLEQSSLQGDLCLSAEKVTARTADGDLDPVISTASPKVLKGHEDYTERHGSRCCLSEVSGLETVLKAEPERACGRKVLQHSASEQSAGRLASLYCDYTAYSRRSHLRTFFAHGADETDADDPSCSYATEMDSESLSFHSELQPISTAEDVGDSVSLGSADMKAELVMVDSVPEDADADVCSAWDGDVLPAAAAYTAHSQKAEGRRDRKQGESAFDVCPLQVPITSASPVLLPPSQFRPTAPFPYPGSQHQYSSPTNTTGHAVDKRSVAPRADNPHVACSSLSVPRQIIHQPAVSALQPISLTTPSPVQGSVFMVLTPQIPAAVPIAPAGPPPPNAPAKRTYRRTAGSNRCSKCSKPRHRDSGHSQYYGHIYCPHTADIPLGQWMEDMRRKRAERKKF